MQSSYISKGHKNTSSNWRQRVGSEYQITTQYTKIPSSSEAQSCKTTTELFDLFFSGHIFKYFEEQTNLYGVQKNTNIDVTAEEMRVFIGGILLSGYAKYSNRIMYWPNKANYSLRARD